MEKSSTFCVSADADGDFTAVFLLLIFIIHIHAAAADDLHTLFDGIGKDAEILGTNIAFFLLLPFFRRTGTHDLQCGFQAPD